MPPARRALFAILFAGLSAAVLLVGTPDVHREPVDEAALIGQIMDRYAHLTGFSASFVQEIRAPSADAILQHGEIRARPPDRIRWWMLGEGGGKVVCDGETLWAWPAEGVIVYTISEPDPADTVFSPLTDLADLTGRFVIADLSVSPAHVVLSMRRRAAPEVVTMVLERDSLALQSVRQENAYGEVVLLRLSEVVLDAAVSGFTMPIPDGAVSQRLD